MIHIIYITNMTSPDEEEHARLKIFEPIVVEDPQYIVPSGYKIRATFQDDDLAVLLQRHRFTMLRTAKITYEVKNFGVGFTSIKLKPQTILQDQQMRMEKFEDFEGACVYGIVQGPNAYAHLNPRGYRSSVIYAAKTIECSLNLSAGEADFFNFIRPQMQTKGFNF